MRKVRTISIAALLLVWCAAPGAQAIVVTTFDDEDGTNAGACALREAVRAINDGASFGGCTFVGGDTLVDLGTGTYVLSLAVGRVNIDTAMTLRGEGPAATTIQRADPFDDDYLFIDQDTGTVTLEGFTIRGVVPGAFGAGAIVHLTGGAMILRDLVVRDNLTGSNSAFRVQSNEPGTVTLERVLFDNNQSIAASANGAALACTAPGAGDVIALSLTDVIFRDNVASSTTGSALGGAVEVTGCSATLRNVTFDGNSATSSEGAALGGALLVSNYFSVDSTVDLVNVTFFENSAETGGAIYQTFRSSGSMAFSLTNVTFAGNSASEAGDHLYQDGTSASISNVLFGPSPGADCAGNPAPSLTLLGGNMDSDGTCTAEQTEAAPGLAPALANNGGFTPTLALLAGSPAIDTGTGAGCPSDDQRGVTRPQDGDANSTFVCDVGAYEFALAGSIVEIPTLSPWGLLALTMALGAGAFVLRRRF